VQTVEPFFESDEERRKISFDKKKVKVGGFGIILVLCCGGGFSGFWSIEQALGLQT